MLCSNCNRTLDDNAIFCNYCGIYLRGNLKNDNNVVASSVTSEQITHEPESYKTEIYEPKLPDMTIPTYQLFFRTVNNGLRSCIPSQDKFQNDTTFIAHE